VIAALIFVPAAEPALSAGGVKPAMDRAVAYLLARDKASERVLSLWSYLALAGTGQENSETRALMSCRQWYEGIKTGELNDYSLLVLTLVAAGGNPYDYQGRNLVEMIRAAQLPDGKFADNIDRSGLGDSGEQVLVNAHIWAVLALQVAGAEIPGAPKARQWLVAQQHADGSFNWNANSTKPDVDSTGMALMALGAMGENKDSLVVQKAVAYLKSVQESDGGFSSWGAPNPESCRMVISGLTAVGIDPAGAAWTKPGGDPLTALLSYQLPDGSFEHVKGGGSNMMATEQSLQGLADFYHRNTLFDRLKEKNAAYAGKTGTEPQRVIKFKPGEAKYEVSSGGIKQVKDMDVAPFVENGRTFVPVRYLALALGLGEEGIAWSAPTGSATLSNNGITVILTVGENILYVNGRQAPMDVTPLLLPPGRAFLPARYVAEAFGYTVRWDSSENAVIITMPIT
jgi:hypothetical protein